MAAEAGDASALESIEAALLAPGAPFETVLERVLGEPLVVFRRRPASLRALLEASGRFGDAEYLVFDERRWSFAAHLRAVAALANALAVRYGVGKGDRVAIAAANGPEWILAFWASVSLGAIAVGLNGWWVEDELVYGLGDCAPKLLIGDEKRLARVGSRAGGLPLLSVERDVAGLLRAHDGADLPVTPIAEDDPAVLLYTSGTSGRPKGAIHSHRNVLAVTALQLFHGYRVHLLESSSTHAAGPSAPCQLVSSPLFHVSGLYAGAVANLAAGVRSVWTTGRWDAGRTLELIERERVTGWSPHGPMAERLLAHPDLGRRDTSSLRVLGTGGAPFRSDLQEGLRRAFPHVRAALAVGYGLTEATALVTMEFGPDLERRPGSVGRPMPTVEVEIRGPEGAPVDAGTEGEVWVRGATVMLGYWQRPEETHAAIAPGRWLRTGDLGRLDEGRLWLGARRTDLILRGAENVSPAEIEDRLLAHPDVGEAAVVGVEHREMGEEVKAIVVPRAGRSLSPAALARWVGEALAYFKVPTQWEIRSAPLPRNAAGKVVRRALLAAAAPNPFAED